MHTPSGVLRIITRAKHEALGILLIRTIYRKSQDNWKTIKAGKKKDRKAAM